MFLAVCFHQTSIFCLGEGRTYVAYIDGCIADCVSRGQTRNFTSAKLSIWVIANNVAQFSLQLFDVYPLYKLLPDAMLAVFLMAGFRDYLGLVGHRYCFVTHS
jgi:hypothetical protein